MGWRWDMRPAEFKALPKKDRARLWHKVYFRSLRRPRMFVPLIVLVMLHMLLMVGASAFLATGGSSGRNVALRLTISSVSMAILVLVFARYAMHVLRDELVAQLTNTCLNCWYDLTGNESGICPECGTPRHPPRPEAK
jgi:hypothetical protein